MNTDYVSLETAKLLKGAGFNTKHEFVLYDGEKGILESHNISLWSAAKWIRDIKGIYIYILPESQYRDCCGYNKILFYSYHFDFVNKELYPIKEITYTIKKYDTYEQALDAGIQEVCKIIINNKT